MKTNLPVRPPLPSLPQEVVLQVISHLQDHEFVDTGTELEVIQLYRSQQTLQSTSLLARSFQAPSRAIYDAQRMLQATCLLNRNWYGASVAALYRYPRLTSKNYDLFVNTVCPSINAHIKKTDLAGMVKVLDLSQLVFAGTKSFIARLLRRLKDSLEVLHAPQTSFAVNSLAALTKCSNLRYLDLSLVTESIPIVDFFRAIEKLPGLRSLHLPRASLSSPKEGPGTRAPAYPPNLRNLVIPGKLSRILSAHAPESVLELESLHLHEVPLDYWDLAFLTRIAPGLQRLTIREPVNRSTRFEENVWEALLDHFAGLKSLRLEQFSSLFHLLSTADDVKEDRPAALDSLEELVIGPVATGADLLRLSNRPFDIGHLEEEEESMSLLDFIDELPNFRRLILLHQDSPSRVLKDLFPAYRKLSSYLVQDETNRATESKEAGIAYQKQSAGVFWSPSLPTSRVDPGRADLALYSIDPSEVSAVR